MIGRSLLCFAAMIALVAGCSSGHGAGPAGSSSPTQPATGWVEDDVSFVADGLTIYGTYRHDKGAPAGPAALLISESGNTDRNGDNAVAGPINNMRQLAEYLSGKGIATLRYDKVGTGKTGLGPYALRPADVGSAVYTTGAKAAVRYLAGQSATDKTHLSIYALGEGAVRAMALADDTAADAPKVHSLALFQPLAGRYLDIITSRVRTGVDTDVTSGAKTRQQGDDVMKAWTAAVDQARTTGTAPAQLPEGLSAILSPQDVKAVVEADAIDPLGLAARVPAATPVLVTCSDSDSQAYCTTVQPLVDGLRHTALTVVPLTGVNHVLRDDPTDNVGKYVSKAPLAPQLVTALDGFVGT